jgi:3',5'-cyclic AMP phosphodiesterase CpdA
MSRPRSLLTLAALALFHRIRVVFLLVLIGMAVLLPPMIAFAILLPVPAAIVDRSKYDNVEDPARREEDNPAFLVQPYLQLPTPTGITVMWETKDKAPGRIEYGTTRDLGRVEASEKETALHELRLEELEPTTRYYFRVRSGDVVSGIYSFKTAPPLGTKKWRMAVYGDSRSMPETHRKVAEQIAKANVDLIVHTGDIVTDGKDHDSWRKQFFDPLGRLARTVPWVSTIGNHERDSENYFSYMALPGNERYFGFDFANAHIVCLDSNAWIQKGRDSNQFHWMQDHFAVRRDATWTFVAFHHPLFSAHKTREINALRWDWAPMFLDPANHIDGVLNGHDHFYARNYRMGRLRDEPQAGVLFLTTAGGGASLYPSVPRDFVATEKSVHHFTLFEFDGDRADVTAIDLMGRVFDRWTMTKQPTPSDEFCAFDVEELRQFLRKAIVAAKPVRLGPRDTTVDAALDGPTRFQVAVSGKLTWSAAPGWKIDEPETSFNLRPGDPLHIRLRADVANGPLERTPSLTIVFDPGKFHNRTIEIVPFTLAGPEELEVRSTDAAPKLDGVGRDKAWANATEYALLGLPPRGGRRDSVRFLADSDAVYLRCQLDDPRREVPVTPEAKQSDGSRLVLMNEHVRVVLSDGKRTETFAVAPDYRMYRANDGADGDVRTVLSTQAATWTVEMAVVRRLFSDWTKVRVNVVHRRQDGKEAVEYQLCPAWTLGTDPDRIPDAKPSDDPARFARLQLDP